MKQLSRFVLFILLLWSVASSSCSNGPNSNGTQKGQVAKVDGFVISALSFENELLVNGSFLALEEVKISSEIAGRIVGIHFKEGSVVTQGNTLFTLENDELTAKLQQTQSRLQLETMQKERVVKLLSTGAVTQQEVDNAVYSVEILKAEKAMLIAQLAKTVIKSPWKGKIGIRNVSEGAVVSAGTHLVTLRQTDKLRVSFWVPERYAPLLHVGNEISVLTDYTGSEVFKAKVQVIEPGIDEQNRSIRIQAIVDNPDNKLLPGSSATIRFLLDSDKKQFAVPSIAIRSVMKGKELMIVDNGITRLVPVTTGLKKEQLIQVIGELKEGDTVLTTGMMQVKPGMQVEFRKVETAK